MDGVTFRRAVNADFEAVSELARQLARHIEADVPALTEAQFERFYLAANAPMQLLLAVAGERVLGMVSWTLTHELYSGEARVYISDLSIDAAARGRGIGKALMDEVAAWAQVQGAQKMAWDVWRHNETAQAFYHRLGGRIDDDALPYAMSLGEAP